MASLCPNFYYEYIILLKNLFDYWQLGKIWLTTDTYGIFFRSGIIKACPYFSFFNINLFLEILYMIIIHSSHTYTPPFLSFTHHYQSFTTWYSTTCSYILNCSKNSTDNIDQEFHRASFLDTTFYLDSKSLDQTWICRDNLARLAHSCNGALKSENRKHRRKRNEYGQWHRIEMIRNGEEPSICIIGLWPTSPINHTLVIGTLVI